MVKNKQWLLLTAALLFALVAIGSFFVTRLLSKDDSGTSGAHALDEGPVFVSTVREAEGLAGFKVTVPDYLPSGFELKHVSVSQRLDAKRTKIVEQTWGRSADKAAITVAQYQQLTGLVGGETATVNGVEGQRAYSPASEDRPYPIVSFFWRQGDFAYVVSGFLRGELTEEGVLKVIASIQGKG